MGGGLIWIVILCILGLIIFSQTWNGHRQIHWNEFYTLVATDNVKEIYQTGDRWMGEVKNPEKLPKELSEKIPTNKFFAERLQGNDRDFMKMLDDHMVKGGLVVYSKPPPYAWLLQASILLLPLGFALAIVLFLLPRFRDPLGGGFLNSYIKSPAKRDERSKLRVTFEDVAGMLNAKSELQEVVEFLRSPEKFQRLGAVVPKGVLLVGPPGTGKTLLARAVAGEAGVPFFSISGSEFIQMFVGVGASRVRDMFKTAKENAPCLPGDTIVTFFGGRQVTIQEMFEQGMVGVQVPAMTDHFRIENATVIGITRKACPDLYQMTTSVGSIKATGNHLFPVWREVQLEWVRLDAIQEGDYVAAPRRIETDSTPPEFLDFLPDQTLVRFEGDAPKKRRSRLHELDSRIHEREQGIACLSIGPGGFASSSLTQFPSAEIHRLLASRRSTSSSRHDAIPAGKMIHAAHQSIGMGQRAFHRGHAISAYEQGKVIPSRKSLQSVVDEMEAWRCKQVIPETESLLQLRRLAHSDVLWTRVQKVIPVEKVDFVYDLCLDNHHCFVANNHITHNCILFIDEIDAVGRMRGAGLGGGSDEREQTLNQILSEMDGFTPTETVIVMAATNRPDVLDSALLRPGRFDRHITIDRPTWQGRMQILKVHTRNKPLADDVDLEAIARGMIGMTGADLRNLANEAALLATREGKARVDRSDFERAADRVLIGAKREEVLSEDEKKRTAYHEAGHTLCAWLTPKADPLFKVTIVPRGRALGVTWSRPDEDRMESTMTQLRARLVVAMGGRAADRLIYNEATSGASQDLKSATRIARLMITQFGMSERVGPVAYRVGEEHLFLGKEIQEPRDFGEGTATLIDEEVRRLLREADDHAFNLLKSNRPQMERLVEALLQKEELLREEIDTILKGDGSNGMAPAEPYKSDDKIESPTGN